MVHKRNVGIVMTMLTLVIIIGSVILISALADTKIKASLDKNRSGAQEVYLIPQQSSVILSNAADVEIWVNANDFYGGQINLTYDPTCANVTNWARNTTIFPLGGRTRYDGREWITFSATPPTPLLKGNYMIGRLTIQCANESEQCCETPLAFVEPSMLSDDRGRSVPVLWTNGKFGCRSTMMILNTGPGDYPSIAGTHNGTITPSYNINVTQLYTYPCPGTGGHTSSVKFWNSTTGWNVTATWNGYTGDWHNLSFNSSFTLYANETYNYTIRTGSYPQIIHAESKDVTGGRITCSEFVDVNGKRYEKGIPAIRLE